MSSLIVSSAANQSSEFYQERAAREKRRRAQSQPDRRGAEPEFRGAALTLQSALENEIIIHGPWQTGKTFAALYRLDSLLRQTKNAQALMVRKKRVDMDASCIRTYRNVSALRGGADAYGGEKPQWFDYKESGARLWIVGLDNPGKALSAEFDFIYANQAEELQVDDWEYLTGRVTGRAGHSNFPQIIGDCNPGSEDHWILKRAATGALRLLKSEHRDNPQLYDANGDLTTDGERAMRTFRSLTGIRRARGYEGKWEGAEGLFFEEWDDELHICDLFDVPADWPVWGAFDYGFSHPTAFGLFTQDNDGCIYLIGEHVQSKWLPPAHCKAIRRLAQRLSIPWHRVTSIVAGHDVFQQRGDKEAKTIAQQYAEARDPESGENIGLEFEKATLDRVTGAQELLTRLGNQSVNIKPTLKFFNTCTRTIATMKRMVVNPRDPEDVLKVDADQNGEGGDDPYDMVRYGVMAKRQHVWEWGG